MKNFNPEKAIWSATREFSEHGGVTPSIERSSTFTVIEPGTMPEIFEGIKSAHKDGCFLYSRHFNPTVDVLSRSMAALENTEAAICTASGMSAISNALLQICKNGDHIVASSTVYGGTHALLEHVLPDMGISTTFVDPADTAGFEKAITPKTKVFYTETIANPTLKVSDIKALSKIANNNNIQLVVDNTFSPMMITPANLGAHVVIHSLTKYINGASDVIAGVICGTSQFIMELMDLHKGRVMLFGPTMDARTAFDVQQRLPHLAIRMKEHGRRALKIAERLQELKLKVNYPGLKSYPQHDLVTSMINEGYGFGAIFSLDCLTTQKANELMSVLQNQERFGFIAVSLGYFDTLMSCSGSSTSSEISDDDQKTMGLSPGLLRISIGFTGCLDSRLEQLERAVKQVGII
jgi:methionine-gamma-lyase